MTINANTKIATLLKYNPDSLEAIITISPKFEKLRNPLLRKLMAGRTSIEMASKISGCTVNDFFEKLAPLGFEIDKDIPVKNKERKPLPSFLNSLKREQLIEFDVRPIITANEDPLSLIVKKVKSIQPGEALKIINTFEPAPLIILLKKQGFESYVDVINDQLVETYFYKIDDNAVVINETENVTEGWDSFMQKFAYKIQTIDVRELEMPKPMLTILDALDHLPPEAALFVYHKRIPVFLLPELKERKFDYRIKEISDNEVHLLIFKD